MENRKFCPTFLFFCSSELEMPFWRLGFVGSEASWHEEWGKERERGAGGWPWCPLIRVCVGGGGNSSSHSWTFLPFWKRNKRTRLVSVRLAWPVLAWPDEHSACQVAQEFSYYSLHAKPLEREDERKRGEVAKARWQLQIHMFDIIFQTAKRSSYYLNRKMHKHL